MGLRKKWHGVGTKVGGLAYRGDLTYALNCIFSLKICIFRLEMKLGRQAGMLFSWGKTGLERDSGFFFRGRLYGRKVDREFIRCL